MDSLAARLKIVRGQLTQKDFSKKISVSQSSYSLYEQGQRVPDALFLNRVCDLFDIDPGWLLTGRGDMRSGTMFTGKAFKVGDMSPILARENGQLVENTGSEKNPMGDTSPTLPEEIPARGFFQGSGASPSCKTANMSAILNPDSGQGVENKEGGAYKTANLSAVLPQDLTARCLRLADENAALLRENGDLRVEVEHLRRDIERRDGRIADLERQLVEALKPRGGQAMLAQKGAAAG